MDFSFDGNEIRGLEQNPQTKSRWAQMARSGKKVMQFYRGALRGERGGWEGDHIRRESQRGSSPGRHTGVTTKTEIFVSYCQQKEKWRVSL